MTRPVNLREKLASFSDHWQPKIVGELNGQQVKLARFQGEFVWHAHADADELFLVVRGSFEMMFRDRTETVGEGEFIHSSSSGVRLSSLTADDPDSRWWQARWVGVRRVLQ